MPNTNKFCLECGKQRNNQERFCKNCGTEYPNEKRSGFRNFLIISAISISVLFIYASSNSSNNTAPSNRILSSPSPSPAKSTEVVVNVYCPLYGQTMAFASKGYGGSGTVMTDSGIILTNSHVIPQSGKYINTNAQGCFVIFPDSNTGAPKDVYLAKPIVLNSISDKYDLAFLEIYSAYIDANGKQYGVYPRTFPSLSDANCDGKDLELGENILVYGYPSTTGGISLTVTNGVISTFADDGIYTSAKIDHGNSGGLATDTKGCFIGVPTAATTGQIESYGYIVPASVVTDFLNDVEKLKNTQ